VALPSSDGLRFCPSHTDEAQTPASIRNQEEGLIVDWEDARPQERNHPVFFRWLSKHDWLATGHVQSTNTNVLMEFDEWRHIQGAENTFSTAFTLPKKRFDPGLDDTYFPAGTGIPFAQLSELEPEVELGYFFGLPFVAVISVSGPATHKAPSTIGPFPQLS
jgi:hypothetical protein